MALFALSVLLAAGAALWVAWPLFVRRGAPQANPLPAGTAELRERRSAALEAIRDLDFDLQAGKLDSSDHHELRGRLEAEAVEAMRRADRAERELPGPVSCCGFANPPGSRFCAGCGRSLSPPMS
ncbi:MAG: hypothetical protein ACREKN_02150 [Longimicrobiaceae bacterium]